MLARIMVVIITAAGVLTAMSLGIVLLPSDPSVAMAVLVMTPFVAVSLIMLLVGGYVFFYKEPVEEPSDFDPADNVHSLENYR